MEENRSCLCSESALLGEDITEEKAETYYKSNVQSAWILSLMGVFLFILIAILSYLG